MEAQYPFGQLKVETDVRLMVRKIMPYQRSNYTSLKEKFKLSKSLNHQNIVKMLRLLEE